MLSFKGGDDNNDEAFLLAAQSLRFSNFRRLVFAIDRACVFLRAALKCLVQRDFQAVSLIAEFVRCWRWTPSGTALYRRGRFSSSSRIARVKVDD